MATVIKIDHELSGAAAERSATGRFCSRCGELSSEIAEGRGSELRVCGLCGMGMLLSARGDALPGAASAFVIVSAQLLVSAVSKTAEGLFGAERGLLGTQLTHVLADPEGSARLARTVARAALRSREPELLAVLRVGARAHPGVLAARVSSCGPPRGALITVTPGAFAAPR